MNNICNSIGMNNIILTTDSYKLCHYKQYPPGTTNIYSYYESRGGEFDETIFFGLNMILARYFVNPVTLQDIDYAERRVSAHMGPGVFNREGWLHIVNKHQGRLPVIIKAVPEGTLVPIRNVLMTIENTDHECYWLTNYLETLLAQVWYPCTVATQSREMKKTLLRYLEITGDPSLIDYKLHDFGFRGVSSVETAGIGGCAHLVNFKGTDTFQGIEYAKEYYGEDMAGFSIPASEHSTMTAWGKEHEIDAMSNMLEQYPTGLVACVSDSYDIFKACSQYWGKVLRQAVLTRDGCLVIRPDSGNPLQVLPRIFNILSDKFGYTTNDKGFRLLHPKVRVIQGDGIDRYTLSDILECLMLSGYSADNITFGSGGGLLQKLNRDTCQFAFKCSSVIVNGEFRDVWKAPVTGPDKSSKRGRLGLFYNQGFYTERLNNRLDKLMIVFRDGMMRNTHQNTFQKIRERADF